jgi:hypothetical protein
MKFFDVVSRLAKVEVIWTVDFGGRVRQVVGLVDNLDAQYQRRFETVGG